MLLSPNREIRDLFAAPPDPAPEDRAPLPPLPSPAVAPPETATVHLRALPGLPNLNQRLMPRFRPPTPVELAETNPQRVAQPAAPLATTAKLPAIARAIAASETPTVRRGEPLRFCVLCGVAVMPWREVCSAHDQRRGRGLPPPILLHPVREPAPDLSEAMTALQPIIPPLPRFKQPA